MKFNAHPTKPTFEQVKPAARGRWREIIRYFDTTAPLENRHGPCPGCGGKDRFRFDDIDGDGTFFCSQGGDGDLSGDGFALLQHIHNWTPGECLGKVAAMVDLEPGTQGNGQAGMAVPANANEPGMATDNDNLAGTNGRGACTYYYTDEHEKKKYAVDRKILSDGSKTFIQWHKKDEEYIQNIRGIDPLPYRLHEWKKWAHMELWITEGEKDADRLAALDLRVTTNSGGASNWPSSITHYLEGYDIIIVEDNDDAGRKRSDKLLQEFKPIANSVKIMRFEDLEEHGDVSDWLDDGHDLDDLLARKGGLERADLIRNFEWANASDITDPILNGNWLVKNVIPKQGIGVLYGQPGSGKTFLSFDLSLHVATGQRWRENKTDHGHVAYIALEGGPKTRNRILAWKKRHGLFEEPNLQITNSDMDFSASEVDALKLIADLAEDKPSLIVIDTLNRALSGGNENDSQDMGAFIGLVQLIANELKCFVLVVHHSGKDEARGSRGHSSLLGAIDMELGIQRKQGEPGIMTITKMRDGEDGVEFGFDLEVVQMGMDRDGDPVTTCVAVPSDAKAIRWAQKLKAGPIGDNQKKVFKIIKQMIADGKAKDRGGLMGIPTGADCLEIDDVEEAFESEFGGPRAKQAFRRALEGLEGGHFLCTKGNNLWPAKEVLE